MKKKTLFCFQALNCSYASYFGQSVYFYKNLPNYPTFVNVQGQTYEELDVTLPILVVNTEFKNDTQLSGFQINANSSGKINLTVEFFF